ncbi:glycosyl transferase family 2 [Stella humosa]|uniref:Glycosyl transferase family 2 n=1 Tax=Stella humosa TaxID=94 RepID=A0A3N1M8E6_9PROT|nr:glycosyltransferase family A protein [Stella humosa]ROP99950.1 glycosyl transferase family 2 [Stella humosa]BBK30820.1 glycosyl transferase family A [Stella humosa]
MTITAVVCVRDGALRLPRALASIRAQTRQPDEVLVVDGRSTDGTAEIARQWGARVVEQSGRGLADARNLALAEARGRLVAFLDHDDRWMPDKLARQAADLAGPDETAYGVAHLRFVADDADGTPIDGPRGLPRLGRTPGTLVAPRALFDRVGPFDPTLGMGCDMDWFVRADAAGCRRVADPAVLLLKTLRADALSADPAVNRAAAFAVIARRLRDRRAGTDEG